MTEQATGKLAEQTAANKPPSMQAELSPFDTKALRWGQIHRGDCQQDNGTLIFHSDGTGSWSCTTLTYHTHSGDIWHASFNIYGANGAFLFNLGTYNSPRMDDGNPPPVYRWGIPFSFNPDFYGAIHHAVQYCSC
jgi:Family of unknown function (DUF6294)